MPNACLRSAWGGRVADFLRAIRCLSVRRTHTSWAEDFYKTSASFRRNQTKLLAIACGPSKLGCLYG